MSTLSTATATAQVVNDRRLALTLQAEEGDDILSELGLEPLIHIQDSEVLAEVCCPMLP